MHYLSLTSRAPFPSFKSRTRGSERRTASCWRKSRRRFKWTKTTQSMILVDDRCLLTQTLQTVFSSLLLEYFFRYKTSIGSSIIVGEQDSQILLCLKVLDGKQYFTMNLSVWKTWIVSHSENTFWSYDSEKVRSQTRIATIMGSVVGTCCWIARILSRKSWCCCRCFSRCG